MLEPEEMRAYEYEASICAQDVDGVQNAPQTSDSATVRWRCTASCLAVVRVW